MYDRQILSMIIRSIILAIAPMLAVPAGVVAQAPIRSGQARIDASNELQVVFDPFFKTAANDSEKKPARLQLRALAFSNMSTRSGESGALLDDGGALLIRQTGDGILVQPITSSTDPVFADSSGLLIWAENGREHWKFHQSPDDLNHALPDEQDLQPVSLVATERSDSIGLNSVTIGASTTPLQQLAGMSLVRGAGGFVTPLGSVEYMNPKITIRRSVDSDGRLPKLDLTLWRGQLRSPVNAADKLAAFEFPQDVATLAWDDIPNLPERLKDGLPSGIYSITSDGSAEFVDGLKVGDQSTYDAINSALDGMVDEDLGLPLSLATLLKVESLLGFKDEFGRQSPYYCDALDAIDRLPAEQLGIGLRSVRDVIRARSGNSDLPELDGYATGVKSIDRARELIGRGQWLTAKAALEREANNDSRVAGLKDLYLAVIESESGSTNAFQATQLFESAIDKLNESDSKDVWRAYNNYGVFLMNASQNLLNNHSFQVASGVRAPLSLALMKWKTAEAAFRNADRVAREVNAESLADVQLNQARLYAILADILVTLDVKNDTSKASQIGLLEHARERASENAHSVWANEQLDPLARGCAAEIIAQLAFRDRDWENASQWVANAIKSFSDAGSLAGAESALRLKGMIELSGDKDAQAVGLKTLMLSHNISDILYQRIPGDETGRSKAGFFSGRAYVIERVVEQLIEDGDAALAIEYAESAKARSLREVLASRKLDSESLQSTEKSRWVGAIAPDLDDGTVILEYFMGSEQTYAFLVTNKGVEATVIRDAGGTPVQSRALIRSVIQLQRDTDHQAKKMLKQLQQGRGLDNSWQDDFHALYQQLIPPEFEARILDSQSLVIVPHHVLHYVPYAALVRKLDPTPDDGPSTYDGQEFGSGIAKPEFLIDCGTSISIAPSIISWDLLRQRDVVISDAAAVGIAEFPGAASLPGVKEDLKNFKSIFGQRVKSILPGRDATKPAVKQLLESPGLLLIATHGMNVADNPLQSFVVCQPTQRAEGHLTALEVFETKVQADLVVMSACYTGLADRSPLPGDDLFGLQRSFLFSGSRAVVSGLWDVYDGTGPAECVNDIETTFLHVSVP